MYNFPKLPEEWSELVKLREYLTDCDPQYLRKEEDRERYNTYQKSYPRKEFLDMITSKFKDSKIALIENIFPHTNVLQNLPSVLHYCLWSVEGSLSEERIREEVDKVFIDKEWMSMTRKEGKVSVAEIWHAHIYVQKS